MKFEDLQLSGSLDISGSMVLPLHAEDSDISNPIIGDLYFNTVSQAVKIYNGTGGGWQVLADQTGGGDLIFADIEYLVVAGGGGGGGWGGGGGAGGLLSSSLSSVQSGSSFTVTIGAGATATGRSGGNYVAGGDGTDSSIAGTTISTITSTGGGGGGYYDGNVGRGGGSGGGGGIRSSNGTVAGGSGTTGQGKDGGLGAGNNTNNPYSGGGGGGGAGAVGSDGQSSGYYYGGDGGDGKQSNITGTPTYYAGGGGGHTDGRTVNSPSVSSGGQGGGGNGGRYGGSSGATSAQDGTANTGGGGGSAWGGGVDTAYGIAGGGGSGVAIFAYNSGSVNGVGGIVGDADNGRKYNQFNTTGTFKVGSTSDFSIVTDSLYLNLDAGNFASRGTSTWTDLSGNSRNGTVTGATLGTNWYYDFDGSNDRIDFSAADIGGTNFTVEVWVNPDSSQVAYANIFDYDHTNSKGFTIQQNNTTTNTYYFYTGGSSNNFTNIPAGTWAHLLVSVSGTSVVQYLNGVQDGTFTASSNSDTTGERITLASWRSGGSYSRYWNGQYGQCRVYNKALTAAEVLQNYNATKTNFV